MLLMMSQRLRLITLVNVGLLPPAGNQQVDAIHVTQLERDTVLVCLDREYNLSPSILMG